MRQIKCKALKVEIKPWTHQPAVVMHCPSPRCIHFETARTEAEAQQAITSHVAAVHRWGRG
jgi:hypothetical protein